ncbi:type II secretion system F family protein [Desulfosporosinus meridiei]|uniref:Type II secretory pathway, component PulF n=1 Tax=Desulfosporosinus meridiei (strain ATCC BAA-275 / DSM 13257 / KCTC 12902 / NCIMB 13706 / S10) TaxID=768704 RepID=J7IN59_DESMD|nr:type II secretion system F family protein [Desulfosporosinus meridiei]AFQ43025.1 type II secretory pathway, component PulF [Desulfosporosinus meridiei DSM 13257]
MSKQHFLWKAVDINGKVRRGIWADTGLYEVQRRLRKAGYFPVWIRSIAPIENALFPAGRNFKWSSFARRLATLLEAGIPILQALEMMSSNERSSFDQDQLMILKNQVESGTDLSEALAHLNPSPNSFILSMIKAGEYTGNLGKVLSEIADELDLELEYQRKIRATLAYPALLFTAIILVLYALSVWILPMYEKLFLSVGVSELPFLTRVIFAGSQKLPLLLGGCLSLVSVSLLVVKFSSSNQWRIHLENLLGRAPLIGKVYHLRDLVQFSRMLSRLLTAGIPLLEALRLTAGTLRSPKMLALISNLILNVRQGKRMAPMLSASGIFPKEGAEMIGIAEEAGQLDLMMHYVTKIFRRDLEEQLEGLMRMIGPLLTIILAGLIGIIAGGVMLPIFDLSSQLQ